MTRILVVDDEEDLAEMTAELLHDRGYEVEVAHDGFDALTALRRCRADLVLLDLQMPRLSGVAMLGWMRASDDLCSVRVIIITGVASMVPKGDDVMHRAVLIKPCPSARLLRVVGDVLAA